MSIPPWLLRNTHIQSGATIGGHAKAFHEVLSEMTSNIRIMNAVSLQLNYNKAHAQTLHWNSQVQHETMDAIEAYFIENDVDYEPFDPEATWE